MNLKQPKSASACPCHSGLRYGECCLPLHRNQREAETPEALMRSRFSAFSIGAVDYLLKTLHPDHADRKLPDDVLRPMIQTACRAHRYMGLRVVAVSEAENRGTVTFHAKVFERGADRSFSETSHFERTADRWRYLNGQTLEPEG